MDFTSLSLIIMSTSLILSLCYNKNMLYEVTVKPGSKKGPLVIADGNHLTVYLREKPVDGMANTALLKLLSSHFKVAKTCIEIKSGQTSRKKRIEIPVVSANM